MRRLWVGVLWWALSVGVAQAQFTHVQSSPKGSCASASNCSTSFGVLPAAGNVVVVTLGCWNAIDVCAATQATDNQNNSYTIQGCQGDATGNSQACVLSGTVGSTPGGTFTVTVWAAAATAFEFVATEYSVPGGSVELDAVAHNASATGTADTGTSAATVASDELAVCVMAQSSANTNLGITTPAGYTRRGVEQNANATVGFESSDKILTSTGTQQCAWSHSTSGQGGWAAQLVTLRAAAAGGGGVRRRVE